MCVKKLLRRRNCLNNIHVNFWINYCNYIITIINNKRETINKKTKKVCSMDKTLVGIEESAGAVIQRCSVNQVFMKSCAKLIGKYLCWSLFLTKFQVFRPEILSKRLQQRCVCVNFEKFCRIFLKICKQLLLNQLGIRSIFSFLKAVQRRRKCIKII